MLQTSLIHTAVGHGLLTRLMACLSESESARALRLRQLQDRRNYVVAHAALRIMLARHLNVPYHEVLFTTGHWGKPELAHSHQKDLHFNLSHSGDMVLIAIASQPIGVDIELARTLDYASLAHNYFADAEIAGITDSATFFDTWTAKEAVVKASGLGLSVKLHQFVVPRPSSNFQPIRLLQPHPALLGLHVAHLSTAPAYHAAICTARTDMPVRAKNLEASDLV